MQDTLSLTNEIWMEKQALACIELLAKLSTQLDKYIPASEY